MDIAKFCHQLLAGLNKQGSLVFCPLYINKIYRRSGCVPREWFVVLYDASVVGVFGGRFRTRTHIMLWEMHVLKLPNEN